VPGVAILGTLGDGSHTALLVREMAVGYEPLRIASRDALVSIGSRDAVVVIARAVAPLLSDTSADRRIDASYVLGKLKSTEAFDAHLKLLQESNFEVVTQAAHALQQIGDARAGAPLAGMVKRLLAQAEGATSSKINEQDVLARSLAVRDGIIAAATVGYVPIVEQTRSLCLSKQADGNARTAAVWALGVLGTPDAISAVAKPLVGRITDLEESQEVIGEAVKAIGNSRDITLMPTLEAVLSKDTASSYHYAAHVARDHLRGEITAFVVPQFPEHAPTSIRDLTAK